MGKNNKKIALGLLSGLLGRKLMTGPRNLTASGNKNINKNKKNIIGNLDNIKARGYLKCGVNTDLVGFDTQNDSGNWSGFDVDLCHAVAAAVFGDPSKVEFTPTTGKTRFTKTSSGKIDIFTSCIGRCFSGEKIPETEIEKVNYSLGVSIATNLKQLGLEEIDTNTFVKAVNDVFNGKDLDISLSDSATLLQDYFKKKMKQLSKVS